MADQLKLSGTLKLIEEPQHITDKLTKRLAVLTTADRYPQDVAVEFINDMGDLLDRYAVGMEVDIYFSLRGREYNGKYYVSLNGWKIEPTGGAAAPAPTAARQNNNASLRQQPATATSYDNELPF